MCMRSHVNTDEVFQRWTSGKVLLFSQKLSDVLKAKLKNLDWDTNSQPSLWPDKAYGPMEN